MICFIVPGGWRVEDFSECNRTCNGGNKTQTKYCDNPLPSNGGDNCPCSSDTKEIHCDGNTATIIETCNEDPCPGEYLTTIYNYDTEPNEEFIHNTQFLLFIPNPSLCGSIVVQIMDI